MPNHKNFTKQMPVMMTDEQHQWLVAQGEFRRVSAAELVRRLVDNARSTGLLDKLAR